MIETEVEWFPPVWVIFRFVTIKTLEIVVEVDALVEKPHHAREHRMVQQIRIVKQRERRKPHRCHLIPFVSHKAKDFRG